MNPSSGRKNTINKDTISSTFTTKNKLKPKSTVISHDYEAAISQFDTPAYLEIDNSIQSPCCSNLNDKVSTAQTKKADIWQMSDIDEIKDKPISFPEITRNIDNGITEERESHTVSITRETQNKTSRIPRVSSNFFFSAETCVYLEM